MKRKIAILTKSSRHGQYCVVGYDIDSCELIRLVSNDVESQGSITQDQLKYFNGETASILDVVEVKFKANIVSDTHPEDILIDENVKWKYLEKFNFKNLPKSLYCTDEFIYADTNPEISLSIAKQIGKSILIVSVENLCVYQNEYGKTKADFVFNNNKYIQFSVTDPDYYGIGVQKYKTAILIISLPDDEWSYKNDRFFKFVAKIYPSV
ncbi:MAG: hypothetical protein E7Z93_02310 [Cyanobacteria bacterium SIG32]|nr:hypothetical protein [Cyanobacteria bacterium SIG32]